MVAEVSAVRKSVDEERQRLSERCAALDREKRQAEAEARAESERLADQVRVRKQKQQHPIERAGLIAAGSIASLYGLFLLLHTRTWPIEYFRRCMPAT